MLRKLDEADFIALREPFESGRQSPKNLSFNLIIAIPLNIILVTLTYLIFGQDEILPYQFAIFIGHVTISVLLIICSLLFAIPAVFIKYQKIQYFLTIATVQVVFSFNLMLFTLFAIRSPEMLSADASTLHTIIFIIIISGLLLLLFYISRRFYRLLQEGAYRANSEKHLLRRKWERKDLMFPVIIAGTGLSLILVNAIPPYWSIDTNAITLLVVGPAVYYLCIFVLPEQLVLLYCKFRFESFNFDKDGELNPTDVLIEDDEEEIQE